MKGDTPPSQFLTLTDSQAVRLLCDPAMRVVLAPFLTAERTIGVVAEQLQMDKNALLLKVRRLAKAGLLRVSRTQRRAGRPIKFYQAVAPGFFVPFIATSFATPGAWMEAEYQAREKLLIAQTMQEGLEWQEQQKPDFGLRFFQRPDGIVEADFAFGMHDEANLAAPDAPAVMSAFVFTELDPQEAKELQWKLADIVQQYERRGTGTGRRYILRLGLAPL